jgi:hypothetical protein
MSTAKLFHLFFLIAIIVIYSGMLTAQVKIKEKVEISPQINDQVLGSLSSFPVYPIDIVVLWDAPILGRLFVDDNYEDAHYGTNKITASVNVPARESGYNVDIQLRVAELAFSETAHGLIEVSYKNRGVLYERWESIGGGLGIFDVNRFEFWIRPKVTRYDIQVNPAEVYAGRCFNLSALAFDENGNEEYILPGYKVELSISQEEIFGVEWVKKPVYWGDLKNGINVSVPYKCMSNGAKRCEIKVSGFEGESTAEVIVKPNPYHFSLNISPEKIEYDGYTAVTGVAIGEDGDAVPLDGDTPLRIEMDPPGYLSPYAEEVCYYDLSGGGIYFWADQAMPNDSQEVMIKISAECGDGTTKVVVTEPGCLILSVSKSKINPSEITEINMMQRKTNGTITSYPPDQVFSVWMNTDEKYGRLRCISTGEEGSYVYGQQPFEFIAADSIDVSSTVVEIEAWTSSGGGPSSSVGIVTKDTLRMPAGLMLKTQASSNQIGNIALTRAAVMEGNKSRLIQKLIKRLHASRDKAKNKSQFDKIIAKIETQYIGKNGLTKNADVAQKSLAKSGQISKSTEEGEYCELPIAEVTIENAKFPSCIDQTVESIENVDTRSNTDPGSSFTYAPKQRDPYNYIEPEICEDKGNQCYNLDIPDIIAQVPRYLALGPLSSNTRMVNSSNDVRDKEDARLVISVLKDALRETQENIDRCNSSITYLEAVPMKSFDKVRPNSIIVAHEDVHSDQMKDLIRSALKTTKSKLPTCDPKSNYTGMAKEQIEDAFISKKNDLKNSFLDALKDEEKKVELEHEGLGATGKFNKKLENAAYEKQYALLKKLIDDISKKNF